jgi:hypothetical protein
MAEGPNDWEWQVGLATHKWKAAEDPVLTGLGTGGPAYSAAETVFCSCVSGMAGVSIA